MKVEKFYKLTLCNQEDKMLIAKLEQDCRWWKSTMGSDGKISYCVFESKPIEDDMTLERLLEDKTE